MPSVDFDSIYSEYENTNDVCKFCTYYRDNNVATRFLLIRSLDKPDLKALIAQYTNDSNEGNVRLLTKKVFSSTVTISNLLSYIENKREELIRAREEELRGLQNVLSNFPIVNCGIRNDKIDDIVKAFVRNKSLKSLDELLTELDNSILPRVRQYSLWSYFNQTSNDIIELFFLRHSAVIPTLRKIHDIDFFVKAGKEIVPFDLKFTHISDSYFDLASQGIVANTTGSYDDFMISENIDCNELKRIKAYYSLLKRTHKELRLPNMSGLSKIDLLKAMTASGQRDAIAFVNDVTNQHTNYVPKTPDELHRLEWWNYKYQGERLFCNNNRLFVFLSFTNKFIDGRELKGKTAYIGEKINQLLDNIAMERIHTIKYHYDKDAALMGDYEAHSISTIYYE